VLQTLSTCLPVMKPQLFPSTRAHHKATLLTFKSRQPEMAFLDMSRRRISSRYVLFGSWTGRHTYWNVFQIEEKYWAHRRVSEAHSEDAASFVGSFKLSSVAPAPPGELPILPDVFSEDEEEHPKAESLAPGEALIDFCLTNRIINPVPCRTCCHF